MSSINKVILIGRLTRDPEMRYTPGGLPVTSFSLATDKWGENKGADFHNCVAWNIGKRSLAEHVANYTKKGSLVYVEGRLQTREWEGQDGQKRRSTEVVVNDVQFLSPKNSSGASVAQPPTDAGDEAVTDVDPDEIPF